MEKPFIVRDLLKTLNKTYEYFMAKQLEKYDITLPQIMVLRQVVEQPKTIGQISKSVDLSYSTVSGIIDRLEHKQLVERKRDETDRRVVWIQRSERISDFKKHNPFKDDFFVQLFSGLSEEQLDMTIETLQLLIRQIETKVEEKP